VTNISGGFVSVFVASDNPATSGCNDGTVCLAADTGCTQQLSCSSLSSDSFAYISVLGLARNTSAENEITFDIQVAPQSQPTLNMNTALNGQDLPGTYENTYKVNLSTLVNMNAAVVTFTTSNVNADSGTITYTMSLYDTACGAMISSFDCTGEDDCSWQVGYCQLDIESGEAYLVITSLSAGNDMSFTLTASAVDIAANPVTLTSGNDYTDSADVGGGDWQMFSVVINPTLIDPSDVTISVSATTGNYVAYESFNAYPGPAPCFENTLPLSLAPCCVEDGTYNMAVQNRAGNTETFTVTATFTEAVFGDAQNLGDVSFTANAGADVSESNYPPNVLMPFSFTLSESSEFASFYVQAACNITFTTYLERISPAGVGSDFCFTNNAMTPGACSTFSANGEPTTLCNFPQCSFPFGFDIGSYQASLLPSNAAAADVSFSFEVGYRTFTDLTTITTTQTLEPMQTDYYTLTLATSTQSASGQYTIRVTGTTGDDFNVFFFPVGLGLCGGDGSAYSCNGGSQCVITYPTCEGTGDFYVVIENLNAASLDYDVVYASEPAFNALDLTTLNQQAIMTSSSGLDHISVDVPALNATQWATFYVGNSNSTAVSVRWTYGNNGPFCFSGTDACAASSPAGECAVVFYDCNLEEGTYIFEITADVGSTYTYGFDINNEPVQDLTLGTVIRGEVELNSVEYYKVSIDRSIVLPGQSISFEFAVECGAIDLYVGQGAIAGGSCGSLATTREISSCDLLTNSIAPVDTDFYLTVLGTDAAFEEYDVPIRYELAAAVVGTAYDFVPIGIQQPVQYNPDPSDPVAPQVMVFSVPGTGEFAGQLLLEAYLPELEDIPATAQFFIGFDVVPGAAFCPSEPSTSCEIDTSGTVCALVLDACQVDGVHQIYIQWAAGVRPEMILQVSHIQGFVRDLDLYDYNPQQGAVSGGIQTSQELVDEEYYRISIDRSAYNFFLSAELVVDEYSARLMTSTEHVPSSCAFVDSVTATPVIDGRLNYEWCELDDSDLEMYFAVDSTYSFPSPMETVVQYNLTVLTTVDTVNITAGVDTCYTIPANGVYYFGLEGSGHYQAGSAIEVTTHGVSSLLDIYVDGNGLASSTCSSTTATVGSDGAETLSYPCPYSKEVVTVAVYNQNTQPASFYLSWNFAETEITPISVNGEALSGSEPTYYSFEFPTVTGESQLIFNAVGAVNDVYYATNQLPRGECPLYLSSSCNTDGCAFSMSQCLYATTDTVYVYVDATGDFTATLFTRDNHIADLSFDEVYEGSFPQSPSAPADFVPVVQSFAIDVDQDDVDAGVISELVITVYGVNQATLTAVVARDQGTIPGTECTYVHASSFSGSTVISIPSCYLTDANYYLGLYLEQGGALTNCADITFGILVTFNTVGDSAAASQLTSGVMVEVPYVDPVSLSTVQYFSFSGQTSASQVLEIQTLSSNPYVEMGAEIMFNSGVGMCASAIGTPVEYVQCAVPETFYLGISATLTGTAQDVEPNSSYSVMATTKSITALTSGTAATKTFESTAGIVTSLSEFFSFDYDDTQSFNLVVEVTAGPAVSLQLLSADCVAEESAGGCECPRSTFAAVAASFDCYYGECQVPVAWLPADISSGSYLLQATGSAPASFSVRYEAGDEGTCAVPESSDFCDVGYPVWNYGTGSAGEAAQNEAAEELYHVFAAVFQQDTCVDLSSACNDSLIEYVCGLAYPACDESGFQTSTCRASCEAVQTDCGFTFEEVGMAYLSCEHNAYLLDDDSICTDIYDVVDDGISTGWKIFLIVLAVLVAIAILALLVVLVGFLGKKAYDARLAPGYDVIDESPSAYGADEGLDGADEGSSVAADGFADYGAVDSAPAGDSAPPESAPPAPPVPPEE